MFRFVLYTTLLTTFITMSGCSLMPSFDTVMPDKQKEYRKSKSLPDLEVPPDLSKEAIEDALPIPKDNETTDNQYSTRNPTSDSAENVQLDNPPATSRNTTTRAVTPTALSITTLSVNTNREEIWPKVTEFFKKEGYVIAISDQKNGIIETQWQEDRDQLTREKFRVALRNNAENNSAVIALTYKGEEMSPQDEQLSWNRRTNEPLLKSTANRLKDYLGDIVISDTINSAATSTTQPSIELIDAGDGKQYIRIDQSLSKSWTQVGAAIRKARIEIEEEDQEENVYFIFYPNIISDKKEESGFFSSLAFWRDKDEKKHFQIRLTDVDNKNHTEVVLLNRAGTWQKGKNASMILNQIYTAMKNSLN